MHFHRTIVAGALCVLIVGVTMAATTTGSLEPTSGTWRAYRGSGFTTAVCSGNSEAAVLQCIAADAERRSATTRYQIRYPNRYVTVTYSAPPPPTANRAPTISGTPPSTGQVGQVYSFKPVASDPDGDKLSFSVVNLPRWATLNASTGELAGTPTANDVAFHASIAVTASDGKASATLKEFSIAVKAATTEPPTPPAGTGTATLSWTPPTQNEDGSALTDLAGYRIVYGNSPTALAQTTQVAPGVTKYELGLAPGTWYFGVKAFNTSGKESPVSNVGSKVIL